jgi:aryl carrier-like protein
MNKLDQIIREQISVVAEDTGSQLADEITSATILLQTGLDSLGFAILVARLESELEYDPFVIMDKPCYPTTYGEFLAIYEKYAPQN